MKAVHTRTSSACLKHFAPRQGNQRSFRYSQNEKQGAAQPVLMGLAMLLCTASSAIAQSQPEVLSGASRDEPPAPRASSSPRTNQSPDRVLRSLKEESSAPSQPSQHEGEGADQRQLDYANGLFHLANFTIWPPLRYQKYLEDYPGRAGGRMLTSRWVNAIATLGRFRALATNLQKVLND